jgi:hypothetical protein
MGDNGLYLAIHGSRHSHSLDEKDFGLHHHITNSGGIGRGYDARGVVSRHVQDGSWANFREARREAIGRGEWENIPAVSLPEHPMGATETADK